MVINFEKTRLVSPYITTKLDPRTLKSVLGSNIKTVYGLYLIRNGIKEVQEFASIDDKQYELIANVRTECGFAGEARSQVWTVTHLQQLLTKKPIYKLKCELKDLMTNKVVYRCIEENKNQDVIYNLIQECIDNLKQI